MYSSSINGSLILTEAKKTGPYYAILDTHVQKCTLLTLLIMLITCVLAIKPHTNSKRYM